MELSLAVLGVPSSAGAYGVGQEEAPEALRRAGLVVRLQERGVPVSDRGDLARVDFVPDPSSPRAQSLGQVVRVAKDVAQHVADMVGAGAVPLILGGDCTITLGVIAGVQRHYPDVSLAYFDGDLDLSTPETTRSGILDAMVVAHLLGLPGSAPALVSVGEHSPLLTGDRLALLGFESEDVDEREQGILDEARIFHLPADQIRADPDKAASAALSALPKGRVVVHFDIDAVNSTDTPLAEYPHFNTGVSLETATSCLRTLVSTPRLAALVVTEVNPRRDPDGLQVARLVDALASALEAAPTGAAP